MANEIKGFLILVIGISCLIYVLRIFLKKITQGILIAKRKIENLYIRFIINDNDSYIYYKWNDL